MDIYYQEPRVRPGAKAILQGLKDAGIKIGMVTHASSEWTMRKLEQTGLLDYFDIVEIASEYGEKTVEHWQKGINALGLTPKQCLSVGDNLKGDIIPSFSPRGHVLFGCQALGRSIVREKYQKASFK